MNRLCYWMNALIFRYSNLTVSKRKWWSSLSLLGHKESPSVSPDAEAGFFGGAFTVSVGSRSGSASGHCQLRSSWATGNAGPSGSLLTGAAAICCGITVEGSVLLPLSVSHWTVGYASVPLSSSSWSLCSRWPIDGACSVLTVYFSSELSPSSLTWFVGAALVGWQVLSSLFLREDGVSNGNGSRGRSKLRCSTLLFAPSTFWPHPIDGTVCFLFLDDVYLFFPI